MEIGNLKLKSAIRRNKAMASGMIKKSEYKKLLWENPHPTSWSQDTDGDIILSSDDYDYLDVEIRLTASMVITYTIRIGNVTVNNAFLAATTAVQTDAISNNFIVGRSYTCKSRTQISSTTGIIARWGASTVETNIRFAVPVRIYGIKYS